MAMAGDGDAEAVQGDTGCTGGENGMSGLMIPRPPPETKDPSSTSRALKLGRTDAPWTERGEAASIGARGEEGRNEDTGDSFSSP